MIRVCEDAAALAQAAASEFVAQAGAAIEARGRFTVALAGGSTPRPAYELLARPPRHEAVDWSRVHVFWGDERCVPADDTSHNGRMAHEALLDRVPLPSRQIHDIACAGDPEAAADRYENELLTVLEPAADAGLDLVILGLGEDGHTASLFPGAGALRETTRKAVAVPATEADGLARVSLTATFLNRARTALFLVSGRAKAQALRAVLQGPYEPLRWPAQLVAAAAHEVFWLVDRDAAAELEGLPALDDEARA
jgi:6-phosphogluconolactonase